MFRTVTSRPLKTFEAWIERLVRISQGLSIPVSSTLPISDLFDVTPTIILLKRKRNSYATISHPSQLSS